MIRLLADFDVPFYFTEYVGQNANALVQEVLDGPLTSHKEAFLRDVWSQCKMAALLLTPMLKSDRDDIILHVLTLIGTVRPRERTKYQIEDLVVTAANHYGRFPEAVQGVLSWYGPVVARSPDTSPDVLYQLALMDKSDVTFQLVTNPHISADTVNLLLERGRFLDVLLRHPQISVETLSEYAEKYPLSVLKHRKCTEDILRKTVDSVGLTSDVICAILTIPTAPTDLVEECLPLCLSNYAGGFVQNEWPNPILVVKHPNLSIETLADLTTHDDPDIATCALQQIEGRGVLGLFSD